MNRVLIFFKKKAYNERDQYRNDKINSEQKLEQILEELNNKISKEKENVVSNFETQFKSLNEQVSRPFSINDKYR